MRMSELQSALFSWYDFNETQKELAYLLKQERHQLECLCIATDLVTFTLKDVHDTVADLKVCPPHFSSHLFSFVIQSALLSI